MLRAVSQGSGGGGSGDVEGPASSTDNAIVRFDGTTGKIIKNSSASVDNSGNITANNFSGSSSGANTGDQTASTLSISSTNFMVLSGSTAQTVSDNTDDYLSLSNLVAFQGWSILTDDFIRGTVAADYNLQTASSGSGAFSINAGTGAQGMGYINLPTGTTAASTAGCCQVNALLDPTKLRTGDKIWQSCSGISLSTAPTASNDYESVVNWISGSNSGTYDKTLTNNVNIYFLGLRTSANWQLSYVDASNSRVLLDTTVPYTYSSAANYNKRMDLIFTKGASAAANTIFWSITDSGVSSSGTVTGCRDFSTSTCFLRPARLDLTGAGVLSRTMTVDMWSRGSYMTDRYS